MEDIGVRGHAGDAVEEHLRYESADEEEKKYEYVITFLIENASDQL